MQHGRQFYEVLRARQLHRLQHALVRPDQARDDDLRVLQRETRQIGFLVQREPGISRLGYARKAPVLALSHRGVRHAIVDVAVELGRLAALEQELDDFERVALVDRSIVALHAKELKDELGPLLQQHVVEALEVELVQGGLLDHQADSALVKVFGQVDDELCQLLAEGCRQGLRCDRQVVDDAEHILQPSGLAVQLTLCVPLSRNLDAIGLVLGGDL